MNDQCNCQPCNCAPSCNCAAPEAVRAGRPSCNCGDNCACTPEAACQAS